MNYTDALIESLLLESNTQKIPSSKLETLKDYVKKNLPSEKEEEKYIEFLYDLDEKLKELQSEFKFSNQDFSMIMNALIYNDFTSVEYLIDHDEEESKQQITVIDKSDSAKEWKKTTEILTNLQQIINDIQELSVDDQEKLIDFISLSNGDYKCSKKGTICCPRKYVANSPFSFPKGIIPVEIRINSKSNANYRVYGILVLKTKTLYLLKAYTKTSGQDQADAAFDSFASAANKFIKDHKLLES